MAVQASSRGCPMNTTSSESIPPGAKVAGRSEWEGKGGG